MGEQEARKRARRGGKAEVGNKERPATADPSSPPFGGQYFSRHRRVNGRVLTRPARLRLGSLSHADRDTRPSSFLQHIDNDNAVSCIRIWACGFPCPLHCNV